MHDLSILFFKNNVYLLLRESERDRGVSGGGAERGTHRIPSRLQTQLSAQSPPAPGAKLTDCEIMT